jgi:hypothetical protein
MDTANKKNNLFLLAVYLEIKRGSPHELFVFYHAPL